MPHSIFSRRGGDDPKRPGASEYEASPAYALGRDDFVYGRRYDATRADMFGTHVEEALLRHYYHCGWASEECDFADVSRGRKP